MQFRDSFRIHGVDQGEWVGSDRFVGNVWSSPTFGFGVVIILVLFCALETCFDPLRLALILSEDNFLKTETFLKNKILIFFLAQDNLESVLFNP